MHEHYGRDSMLLIQHERLLWLLLFGAGVGLLLLLLFSLQRSLSGLPSLLNEAGLGDEPFVLDTVSDADQDALHDVFVVAFCLVLAKAEQLPVGLGWTPGDLDDATEPVSAMSALNTGAIPARPKAEVDNALVELYSALLHPDSDNDARLRKRSTRNERHNNGAALTLPTRRRPPASDQKSALARFRSSS